MWNVQGIPAKVDNMARKAELQQVIRQYDFIGLSETWLNQEQIQCDVYTNIVDDYDSFHVCRGSSKYSKGGICIYFKSCYKSSVMVVKSYDDVLWVKISASVFNTEQDIYFCSAYFPPEISSLWIKRGYNPFDRLKSDIEKFSKKGLVLIGGDLNSRIGNLTDVIESNNNKYSPLPAFTSLYDIPSIRNNMDTSVNSFGRELIDLCISSNLIVVNGRTLGDFAGRYTCFTYNGSSTVDYILVSPLL